MLDVKLAKSEKALDRETTELHNALATIERETDTIEEKIKSMRDPGALEAAIIHHRNELASIETRRLQRAEELAVKKSAVISEILSTVNAMTNAKQYKDKCFAKLNDLVGDTIIEMIDSSIVDELDK